MKKICLDVLDIDTRLKNFDDYYGMTKVLGSSARILFKKKNTIENIEKPCRKYILINKDKYLYEKFLNIKYNEILELNDGIEYIDKSGISIGVDKLDDGLFEYLIDLNENYRIITHYSCIGHFDSYPYLMFSVKAEYDKKILEYLQDLGGRGVLREFSADRQYNSMYHLALNKFSIYPYIFYKKPDVRNIENIMGNIKQIIRGECNGYV